MTAHEREELLAAAYRAYFEDGWHVWELPEIVLAAARAAGIPCSPATARLIVTDLCGRSPED